MSTTDGNWTVYSSGAEGGNFICAISTEAWSTGYYRGDYKPVKTYSTDWECPHCGRLNPANLYQCAGCTAPRRKEYE